MTHFSKPVKGRQCKTCEHFLGYVGVRELGGEGSVETIDQDVARCGMGGNVTVHANASRGCAFWIREPGSDDDS